MPYTLEDIAPLWDRMRPNGSASWAQAPRSVRQAMTDFANHIAEQAADEQIETEVLEEITYDQIDSGDTVIITEHQNENGRIVTNIVRGVAQTKKKGRWYTAEDVPLHKPAKTGFELIHQRVIAPEPTTAVLPQEIGASIDEVVTTMPAPYDRIQTLVLTEAGWRDPDSGLVLPVNLIQSATFASGDRQIIVTEPDHDQEPSEFQILASTLLTEDEAEQDKPAAEADPADED